MRDKRRKREPEQRSFLFSLEEEAKLIDRRFFKHVPPPPSPPPAPPGLPFLRLRPTPPKRRTAKLIALKRSSKLRDIVIGHDEHLFFDFLLSREGQN